MMYFFILLFCFTLQRYVIIVNYHRKNIENFLFNAKYNEYDIISNK